MAFYTRLIKFLAYPQNNGGELIMITWNDDTATDTVGAISASQNKTTVMVVSFKIMGRLQFGRPD